MKNKSKNMWLLILSALAMVLTFSPINAWILGFFGLIPFLYVLYTHPYKGFAKGYLFGFIYSFILVHWLAFNSGAAPWLVTLSAIAAAAALALNYGVIGWLTALYLRRNKLGGLLLFPFLWTVVEFLRSFGTLGFQWVLVANGQTANLAFIQLADVGGPFLISFILVSINTLLFVILFQTPEFKKTPFFCFILLGLFLVIPYSYGIFRLYQTPAFLKSHYFRIVQPNYNSQDKWEREKRDEIFETMIQLSRDSLPETVEIIVWPESATPVYLRAQAKYRTMVENLTHETGTVLVTGVPDYFIEKDEIKVTNSLFVFEPNLGLTGKYSKQRLVPFGEYIPFSNLFPALSRLNLGQGNFTPGRDEPLITLQSLPVTLAPMICYESVFSSDAIRKIREGGEYHILVTNDSWFGNSWGPYQHASQSIFRAVESRRPVIRCANTGISMAIDHTGRIIKSLPLNDRGYIDVFMGVPDMQSHYVQKRNAFSFILCGIVLGVLLTPIWPVRKGRNDS
ncbi:MAG: apolipoprotein N-acyltransferase [Candidatus Marinimicrobia bacterium]|nr:apolipoprotein N-acyltransferase [Candidatus Neomarinimicrobiota bacterium]MDD5581792.1 apolipoprotein N-acyltransferase [Candidatus Neomarinimicrobiota bacterium]